MILNASVIKKRLFSVPRNLKDNEAQNIISTATINELKGLDLEAVMRLYEALVLLPPKVYSNRDAAAVKKLKDNTRFRLIAPLLDNHIALIKKASGSVHVNTFLSADLIKRLYAAEKKRLSLLESMGIDGATIGSGQLGQPAYDDVKKSSKFKKAFEQCLAQVFISRLLKTTPNSVIKGLDFKQYKLLVPARYKTIIHYSVAEDFVVAAYLSLRIIAATKAGRSAKDTLKFAVGWYHGMSSMMIAAQNKINNKVDWAPVEAELIRQGYQDQIDYINEIVL